jgi:hypothetical protein
MTVASSPRHRRSTYRRPPATVTALGALLPLLVIGALQGGMAMVMDPMHPMGMTTDYLEGAPVHTYFWPGWFLLGIAAASIVTTVGLFSDWQWHWARGIEETVGYRWPWIGAVSIGIVLLTFEVIELFVVPFHPVMHPLLIATSLSILGLAGTPSARRRLAVRR